MQINPQIILPLKIAKLSDKEIEYVLLHELAHYRQKDVLINFQLLENFSSPLLAPRLLGMVNSNKSIERRIKMIKIAELYKRKRNITIIVGVVCVLVLGVVLLTNRIIAQIKDDDNSVNANTDSLYTAEEENIQADTQKPKSLEEAISDAIKAQGKSYRMGELVTEGHIILGKEEKDGEVKVYTISSVGCFGFEDGIFTRISGSGAVPIGIIFAVDENGEFSLVEYKRPMDGEGYMESIYEMFPEELHDVVLSAHEKYPEILKQQEEQAADYLKSIGRKASVNAKYSNKTRPDIDREARGVLFAVYNKFDAFLNTCPDWIGSREYVENGIRYIYETSQGKTVDGYDLITFKKTKEDGTLIEERKYKIVGSSVHLEDYTSESEKTVNLPKEDKVKAFDVIKKYFYAFAQHDYEKMRSLSTDRHNEEYMHDGDVWGMKWAMAREIKMVGNPEFLRSESLKTIMVFDVFVDMRTVETSALYPSTQSSFHVILEKGEDGVWRVDRYSTV